MFTRKLVDSTALPIGTVTKRGKISVCEQCGKPGAYISFTRGGCHMEKWVHQTQYKGPSTSCPYSIVTGRMGKDMQDGATQISICGIPKSTEHRSSLPYD